MATVEITLDEFETYLRRAFRAMRPKKSLSDRHEYFFDLNLSKYVAIRVWSSIGEKGVSAQKGADAIRVQMYGKGTKRPLKKGKSPIVKRTPGWKGNLKNRIGEIAEEFEDREDYWDYLASGARDEKLQREKEAPSPPPPPPPPVEEEEPEEYMGSPKGLEGQFTKLKNGDWGIAISGGGGSPGASVMVKKKSGQVVPKFLGQLVWKGRSRFGTGMVEIWTDRDSRFASENFGEVEMDIPEFEVF